MRPQHWRISVADISGEAVFSSLPGWDRLLIPLDNAQLSLRIGLQSHQVDLEHPVRFRGEDEVSCAEPQRPIRVINVMTNRNAASLDVSIHSGGLDSEQDVTAIALLSGWARANRRIVFAGTVFRGSASPIFSDDARVARLRLSNPSNKNTSARCPAASVQVATSP